jgi:hypothetical protein
MREHNDPARISGQGQMAPNPSGRRVDLDLLVASGSIRRAGRVGFRAEVGRERSITKDHDVIFLPTTGAR